MSSEKSAVTIARAIDPPLGRDVTNTVMGIHAMFGMLVFGMLL